jgi:dihydroxy-acid dehydratase
MYTANTMASAIEAMGMSLPNSGAQAAVSSDKLIDCFDAGAAVMNMIKKGITPRDIMTKEAFENAITLIITLGGSTNAVLHLIAMAHAAGVKLGIDDFTRIGKKVPVLGDLKPSGKYFMNDLVKIGGTVPLIRILVNEGLMHGDCLTVTGKTVKENMKNSKIFWPKSQTIVRPLSDPIKKDSHLVIFRGNLCPEGAVGKISGKEGLKFEGKAIVFESEETALQAILNDKVKKGHVIVVRMEGPKGGPGMREMLSPTSAAMASSLATSRRKLSWAAQLPSSRTATRSPSTLKSAASRWAFLPRNSKIVSPNGSSPSRATHAVCWRSMPNSAPAPASAR